MKMSRVFRNTSWIIACRIAQSVLALLINALTARYFGPSNYGLINYAASLVAFVTPVMKLGTSEVLVHELIKNPDREGEVLGTSMAMTFLSSLFCVAGLSVFAYVANADEPMTVTVVTLYSLLLISQSLEQIQYWFHAKYLSKYASITGFCMYVVISIYKIILLAKQKDVRWFAVSNSLDHLLIAVTLIWIYRFRFGQKLKCSLAAAGSLWNQGKHYIIPELMGLVLAQSDRIMLRWIHGDVEVGFYSAALSICGLTSFVFSAIITSLRPAILESKARSETEYESNMIKLYSIIIYLSVLQSLFLTLFPGLVVGILYGQAYAPTIPMLRLVVWYTSFSYIGGVRAVWILAENKQKYLWIISFTGMILNVALNALLIPRFGGNGAAAATLVTQIVTNIVMVYLIRPLRPNISYIIKAMNPGNLTGKRN